MTEEDVRETGAADMFAAWEDIWEDEFDCRKALWALNCFYWRWSLALGLKN